MTGYPSLLVTLLQGLLTAAILTAPPMALVFGTRLRTSAVDIGLAGAAVTVLALGSILLFWPFEGDLADRAFAPLWAPRSVLIGGAVMTLGAILLHRRRLGAPEVGRRVFAAFLVGALWGAIWGFAGWCLQHFEVLRYG